VAAVERDEWRHLASEFEDHNYRQCWDYAEAMAARTGATAEHRSIANGGRPLGLASLRIKTMPGTGTGIAYVSGGPLVRRDGNEGHGSRLRNALAALVDEYVYARGLVLRVAPAIGDAAWNVEQEHCFLAADFRPVENARRYNTISIDIARPMEDVRASLAGKWRNHLRKAEKAEVDVTAGSDPALFDDFQPLFDEFVARKSFAVELGADFYGGLQTMLPEHERLHVAIARVEGRPAAGIVASLLGDTAVYLLGASNELGRSVCAPYLLQWEVINAAAKRGARWYDLGGIDPEGNPGVYRFKARMGGIEHFAPGPYQIAPGRVRAGVVRGAERLVRATRVRRG
jgi:hypothetical protein